MCSRERTGVPARRQSPVLDYTLVIVGAVAALAGLYFQFAPSDWWLAHFSEAYQYGAYTLGGVLLGPGSVRTPNGTSTRAVGPHGCRSPPWPSSPWPVRWLRCCSGSSERIQVREGRWVATLAPG